MTRRLVGPCVVVAMIAPVFGVIAEAVDRPAFLSGAPTADRQVGSRLQQSPPLAAPYLGYSLTYDGFGGTCSATDFSITATAHQMFPTNVQILGSTTLNGTPYDTYTFGLGAGTLDFPTGFSRTFAPPQPTATWTFVFNSNVTVSGASYGNSVTTITCTDGVPSVVNAFDGPQVIPTLGVCGLGILVLLVGGAAFFLLRQRA